MATPLAGISSAARSAIATVGYAGYGQTRGNVADDLDAELSNEKMATAAVAASMPISGPGARGANHANTRKRQHRQRQQDCRQMQLAHIPATKDRIWSTNSSPSPERR